MRIPREPPDPKDIYRRKGSAFDAAYDSDRFTEFIRLCESRYWPWDRVRVAAGAYGVDPEIAWAVTKIGRSQRERYLPLRGAGSNVLKFNTPDIVQRELMLVDQQTAGRLLVEDQEPLPHHQRERFIMAALREEAIASSMLEGAVTTRRDAQALLRSGRKPKTLGERMVVNNYNAIMFVREHLDIDLSSSFLLELQSILTEGTLEDEGEVGRFRSSEDEIKVIDDRDNTIVHVPPSADEIESRITDLCNFANGQADEKLGFIHPLIRACVLHFQLAHDHPFCDGNGRTARALFYWSMLKDKYWLFEYLPISRLIYNGPAKYVRAFLYSETDDFDITYFLTYKARIISKARQDLREFLLRKQEEMRAARRLFANDRRLNHRQREIVMRALRNPDQVFTIAELRERFGVAYATARSDLLNLSHWGYLMKSLEGKKYEFFPVKKSEFGQSKHCD